MIVPFFDVVRAPYPSHGRRVRIDFQLAQASCLLASQTADQLSLPALPPGRPGWRETITAQLLPPQRPRCLCCRWLTAPG
jgi:hypothetical protein